MEFYHHAERQFRHILSIPFIYLVFFPIVLLDIVVELYHHICFPLYGLPKIDRRRYIKIDRHRLSYLNWVEKINCMYCGYGNGFFRYASAIAAATETYWCGIKHKEDQKFQAPEHHASFLPYDDKEAFERFIKDESDT